MAQEWFYARGGAQQGPVDADTIRRLIAAGQFGPNDLVWREGMPQWTRAMDVAEFYAPAQPQYAPPPPATYGQPSYGQPRYGQTYEPEFAGPTPLQYQTPPDTLPFAGFWLRLVAAIIDGVILNVVQVPITLALGGGPFSHDRQNPGAAMGGSLLSIVIAWLYSALQESSSAQATLGKRAVGIIVVDERTGEQISFAQATGRHFAKIISSCILLIGFIMAAFTQKKQALHDIMAGTLVLRAAKR
jgi:uncharacterized RDD family membrane protein YckC